MEADFRVYGDMRLPSLAKHQLQRERKFLGLPRCIADRLAAPEEGAGQKWQRQPSNERGAQPHR
jgi:hypothetical protein